ncbi:alcohol dehydrogenase [Multifurca ochricompacta]|uniref:Alcohol dehydrogenase n=1 Tax=Multifurca ochricompacta TaxID=376703 RepID=A0AAD4QQ27_9AGAM|nr:alcohol dehydrogenase [Multifurca ochricompacta]
MSSKQYTRILLNERPVGTLTSNIFRIDKGPLDLKPGAGEVLIQVTWLSLDPAMRGWVSSARSYVPPVPLGDVMRSYGLGTVKEVGEGTKLKVGDVISAWTGWTEYAVLKESEVEKLQMHACQYPPGAQLIDFLGAFGATGGLTAYFGLFEVAKIKAGETVVVSGAAGSVGSLVCQIAKLHGAKVIGIAGSEDKCKWLKDELKIDGTLNYKSPTFKEDFKEAVGYLDVFFDNVGGEILDFALTRLNKGARITLCDNSAPKGLSNYLNLIFQRGKIEGFVVLDYADRFSEALNKLSQWISEGSLIRRFHIIEGLEKAPEALPLLFSGGNTGKLFVLSSCFLALPS